MWLHWLISLVLAQQPMNAQILDSIHKIPQLDVLRLIPVGQKLMKKPSKRLKKSLSKNMSQERRLGWILIEPLLKKEKTEKFKEIRRDVMGSLKEKILEIE